ncbi:uncharacterized protein CCOS01_06170 [Colletotrichum costaricense]|uniref:Uncharacterized protein n=1 Tax=Colletotrichum costaricense TaxID=1209916 RepID=A0AAI9Z346_9PEZI|nr:uncharacterized protein CCOS01_06170 [Colletotrichum costaricense]KAK1531067.1 hypothetical protein CCOS01_06170 [Colletotrichum costaricense]
MGTPSINLLFAAYCKVPTLPSSVLGEYRDQLDQGSKVPRKRCTVRTTVDPPSTLHSTRAIFHLFITSPPGTKYCLPIRPRQSRN